MTGTQAEHAATLLPVLSIPVPIPGAGIIPGIPGSIHVPGSPDIPGLSNLPGWAGGDIFGGGGSGSGSSGGSGSGGSTAPAPGSTPTTDGSALHPLVLQLGVAILAIVVLVTVAGSSRRGAQIAGVITVTLWLLWMINHQSHGYSGLGIFASSAPKSGGVKAA